MLKKPMDVLALFPVRKTGKQKEEFRRGVEAFARSIGYSVTVEKGSLGSRNVVIGNAQSAKYLITAHYDTPASIGLPNILTPCNAAAFILWQILLTLIILFVSVIPGVLLGALLSEPDVASLVAAAVCWVLVILLLFGPANRNNANDNTSGVVTLLETAAAWPEASRDSVCFVLFDLEEAGLIGSASYRQKHKESKHQLVLNLDCVGDGDEILLFPCKRIKRIKDKVNLLNKLICVRGDKSISVKDRGFAVYPSDQGNFPYGVGIAAFRRKKGIGLYVSRIHTWRDTILDEKNVIILRDALLQLAGADAAE